MTTYSLLLERCGLSHREAAEFHGVRPDTVKSWSAGRNPAPPGVIEELRSLYRRIEAAAGKHVAEIERLMSGENAPNEIELGLARSDTEAKRLGLPCVGAHGALLGIVAARLNVAVKIVPRGSTKATSTAVKAHEFILKR